MLPSVLTVAVGVHPLKLNIATNSQNVDHLLKNAAPYVQRET